MSVPPFTITSQLAREPLPVTGEPQVAYILIELRANSALNFTPPPLNLGLVLDRSGSMRGPRLHHLKEGLMRVIDDLTPEDRLSIVTFDDTVDLVVPAQAVEDPEVLKSAVSLIEDGGGTMMALGLSMGLSEVRHHAAENRTSRIVLLTDGVTGDADQCRTLAADAGTEGVPIEPIGFGAEWDDAFLEMLSTLSGGAPPDYVRRPADLGLSFTRRVRSARSTVARGLQVSLRFVAGVTPRRVTRVSPFLRLVPEAIEDRAITMRLGDLERDQPQSLLVEAIVEPKKGGTFRIAQIETTSQTLAESVRADVVVTFSASASKRPQMRPVVLHYVERAAAAQVVLRALEEGDDPRPIISPNIVRLFDVDAREWLDVLRAGGRITPEGRKVILAQVRELTRVVTP